MLLTPAAFLVLSGFVLFVIGNVRGYTGVAVIGGVLIVGVGASVVDTGLRYESGEERIITNESANETVVSVDKQYQHTQTPINLPLGLLVMVAGGLLSIQSLNEVS